MRKLFNKIRQFFKGEEEPNSSPPEARGKNVTCRTHRGKVIVPDDKNYSCYTYLVQLPKKMPLSEFLTRLHSGKNENIIAIGYKEDYKHWDDE